MILEVLVEGGSDVPIIHEILTRRFGLSEQLDFRIHPHRGKGRLPERPELPPEQQWRGLLDQLPAKLRGYARSHVGAEMAIVVVVDADQEDCRELKASKAQVYQSISPRPPLLLARIAVEETESWLIAEPDAVKAAYPKARVSILNEVVPDTVCGAWEKLAESLGLDPRDCVGADKYDWAERIAPELDLDMPRSPSLRAFICGVERILGLS